MYDAILVVLHTCLAKLPLPTVNKMPVVPPAKNPRRSTNPTVLLALGDGSVQEIVSEICKMIYYQLLSCPGKSGALYLIFPVQVAYRYVDRNSREAAWLHRIMSHIAEVYGFGSVTYARDSTDTTVAA